MYQTELPVKESEDLAADFLQSVDRLLKTAKHLKRSEPLPSEDLVRELSLSRKSLLDLCGRILQMEMSLQQPPKADSASPSAFSRTFSTPGLSQAASDTPLTADEDGSFVPSTPPPLPSDPKIRGEIEAILAELGQLTDGAGETAPSLPQAANADRIDPAEILMDMRRAAEMVPGPPSARTLAEPHLNQSRQDIPDPLRQQALELTEKALRAENAAEASTTLGNLALLYHQQGNYALAETLHKETLAFREKFFGPEHPLVGTTLNNLARLYYDMSRYAEAEMLCRRSLEIVEKTWGPEHPKTARRLSNLADLYLAQGNSTEAEPLYQRALAIRENNQEPEHPAITASLKKYAEFLRKTKRKTEASIVEARSKAIRARRPQLLQQ